MPKLKTIWRVFSYLKRYPRLAISTLGCAIASTVLVVVFPGATRYILNDVVSGHPSEHLVLLVSVVAIAMLLRLGGSLNDLWLDEIWSLLNAGRLRDPLQIAQGQRLAGRGQRASAQQTVNTHGVSIY